jgi:cobalt-zinc-cadmium efflux system protein
VYSTPVQFDVQEIGWDLVAEIDAVEDMHHVHGWSLPEERSLLTSHARISEGADSDSANSLIKRRLAERFDIIDVTVEIELESCTDHAAPATG